MGSLALGVGAALASATCYGVGVTLQALEAREAPGSESLRLSLLRRLLKRPRWIAGTLAVVSGWGLQALALALAPLTIVQPALAFSLVVLLVAGVRIAGEDVGIREGACVAAIVAGVAGLALVAPKHSTGGHAGTVAMATTLGAFGVVVLAPYALRRRGRPLPYLVIFSAGMAYAWSGFSTKLAADALSGGEWLTMLMWLAATIVAACLGLLSEMTALQGRSVIGVFPAVLVIQLVAAVVLAPVLAGEGWSSEPLVVVGLAVSLAVVATAAVVLARARAVTAAVDTEPSPGAEATSGRSASRRPRRRAEPVPAAGTPQAWERAGRSP